MQRPLQVPVPSNETTDAPPPQVLRVSLEGNGPQTRKPPAHSVGQSREGEAVIPTGARQGRKVLRGGLCGNRSWAPTIAWHLERLPESGDTRLFPALQLALLSPPGPGRLHSLTIPGTRMGTPDTPSAGTNRLRGGEKQERHPSPP